MGIETLTFQPLNTFSENATSLHADIKADILENIQEGNYQQGLVDQYKLQLARLEPDQLLPVCELISFPGFLSFPSMLLPSQMPINSPLSKQQTPRHRGRNISH